MECRGEQPQAETEYRLDQEYRWERQHHQPGKLSVISRKAKYSENTIPKSVSTDSATITGRQERGKLDFLIRLPYWIKVTFHPRDHIGERRPGQQSGA